MVQPKAAHLSGSHGLTAKRAIVKIEYILTDMISAFLNEGPVLKIRHNSTCLLCNFFLLSLHLIPKRYIHSGK